MFPPAPPPPPPPTPPGRSGAPPPRSGPVARSTPGSSSTARVIAIPLSLLLHPIASEWPYAMWITDAQASHGGVRVPIDRDGFRMYFEYARAVLRSSASDSTTRLEAKRFAEEIYRVNLEHYGTAPWLRSDPGYATTPMKRRYEGEGGIGLGMQRRPLGPGRIREISGSRSSSSSSTYAAGSSSVAGPSSASVMSEDDLMGDAEAMDVDSDDNDSDDRMMGAAPQTPSPERERRMRIAGTSAQRAAAGMILAKQTNMRGQWREGSVLVPVPNARGWPPPADLPPLRTLSALHALDDTYLAHWLRFYDGEDCEVPSTRYAREIALCSRLGVMWSPSASSSAAIPRSPRSPRSPLSPMMPIPQTQSPLSITTQTTEFPHGSPPPGPQSAPARMGSNSPPLASVSMSRTRTDPVTPIITISPPTPTHTPPPGSPTAGPQSAPPATPPHRYVSPNPAAYSYSTTHPRSIACTHRYRRSGTFEDNFAETYAAYRRNVEAPSAPSASGSSGAPQPLSSGSASASSASPATLASGYTIVMRNGVPYAMRWAT